MKYKKILSDLLGVIGLMTLIACQVQLLPSPTDTSSPITTHSPTLLPSATLIPTLTLTPTMVTALCGTPATGSSSSAPLPLAKFEPPDGQIYFGFTYRFWDERPIYGDVRPFSKRICDSVDVELAGKTPTIIKVTSGWPMPFDGGMDTPSAKVEIDMIHSALGTTVIPMLEWEANTNVTTKDIASGKFDQYIIQFARDVKQYGKPVFIRLICGEFNGNWWQHCSPKANPNLTSTDFVSSWRRVVDIFRQEGATNVAWVWTPVAPTPSNIDWGWDRDWQSYYPGDEYVDWVGADLNTWGRPAWLDPVYKFSIDHEKPFFLAEFAIRHEGTTLTHKQQVLWLTAMFDYFESHPNIKAILYFNSKNKPDDNIDSPDRIFLYDGQVNYVPNVNDHDQRLIAGGEDIRELFSSRIADPRYISILTNEP
jgi:hypothetical protein